MKFTPYLSFQGQCAQAMAHYAEIFGATPQLLRFSSMAGQPGMPELPPELQDWVMHGEITLPDGNMLMGADMPAQYGGEAQAGVSVALSFDEIAQARDIFERLAKDGTVTMPFGETFFSAGFGMAKDRFGTSWMVMTTQHTDKRP